VPTLACKYLLITNGERVDKSLSDSTGVSTMKRGKKVEPSSSAECSRACQPLQFELEEACILLK